MVRLCSEAITGVLHTTLLFMLAAFFTGCDGNTEPAQSLVGPNLNGAWTGTLTLHTKDGTRTSHIIATINHTGDSVIIHTNGGGTASLMTGTIEPDGSMILTDALDGENWTTHFSKAIVNRVIVADYIQAPVAGELTRLNVLDLRR